VTLETGKGQSRSCIASKGKPWRTQWSGDCPDDLGNFCNDQQMAMVRRRETSGNRDRLFKICKEQGRGGRTFSEVAGEALKPRDRHHTGQVGMGRRKTFFDVPKIRVEHSLDLRAWGKRTL